MFVCGGELCTWPLRQATPYWLDCYAVSLHESTSALFRAMKVENEQQQDWGACVIEQLCDRFQMYTAVVCAAGTMNIGAVHTRAEQPPVTEAEQKAWMSDRFEKLMVPEVPPPAAVC